MFEGLKLNKELVEYQNQHLKEKVSNLSDEQRKHYYSLLEPALKDHDTYAVLNYLLVAGLHHFYLGKFLRGAINLIILASGIGLIIFYRIYIRWNIADYFYTHCGAFGTF